MRCFAPLGILGVIVTFLLLVAPQDTAMSAYAQVSSDNNNVNQDKMWVYFTDKGYQNLDQQNQAIQNLKYTYNQRAIQRRELRRTSHGLFDVKDLPVAPQYIDQLTALDVQIIVESKWLNAVSIKATPQQLEKIADLPFVKKITPVLKGKRRTPYPTPDTTSDNTLNDPMGDEWYGWAAGQLNQINVIALHNQGYTGKGVIVGILDTGFRRIHDAFNYPGHEVQIVAEWDFINNDPNTDIESGDPDGQHSHGTLILGTLAGYDPNIFVGTAYDASFILCKTEDISNEYPQEEDFYVAGLEFIEANGGDVATSSLGYIDWYTQNDLDGETAVTTIGVNNATANGIHCCTAAGNEGHDSNPGTSHLLAPSDAFQVIACGAAYVTGEMAGFSSDGPTADGRVKPEVCAQGVDTWSVSSGSDTGAYTTASGTSLSTPLVAGAVACLTDARPGWTVDEMRDHLFTTADYYLANGTFDPQYIQGYGILNAYLALDLLDFQSVVPGESGMSNSFNIANATPNKLSAIVYGLAAGETEVPSCSGLFVQIQNPKIAGYATSDANGNITLERYVPAAASGREVYLQAVEPSTCRLSNLFVITFI